MTGVQIQEARAEDGRAKARRRERHERNKAKAAEEDEQATRAALEKQSEQEAIAHGLDELQSWLEVTDVNNNLPPGGEKISGMAGDNQPV